MPKQIKFTVTDEAVAYLRWMARNILFVKSEDEAAKHLMTFRLEEIRRQNRRDEPSPEDLAITPNEDESTSTE